MSGKKSQFAPGLNVYAVSGEVRSNNIWQCSRLITRGLALLDAKVINELATQIVHERVTREARNSQRPQSDYSQKSIIAACIQLCEWVSKHDIEPNDPRGWIVAQYESCIGSPLEPRIVGTCGDCRRHFIGTLFVNQRYEYDFFGEFRFTMEMVERRIAMYVADTGIPFE